MQRIDLTLCFQVGSKNQRFIDFYDFPYLLTTLKNRMKNESTMAEFIEFLKA